MKKLLIFSFLVMLSLDVTATSLNNHDWNAYYSQTKSNCISNQANMSGNSGLPIGLLKSYCSCYARYMANSITYELINYVQNTGDSSELVLLAQDAGNSCAP